MPDQHDLLKNLQRAMELDQQGEWDQAHEIAQGIKHPLSYQIHAYLHRKEGDMSNANYWYQRVGMEPFTGDLESERNAILKLLTELKL